MNILRRLYIWWESQTLISTRGKCSLCEFEGWTHELRRHVMEQHWAEYRFAQKHGRLPMPEESR
jgi:hypothetical protein